METTGPEWEGEGKGSGTFFFPYYFFTSFPIISRVPSSSETRQCYQICGTYHPDDEQDILNYSQRH